MRFIRRQISQAAQNHRFSELDVHKKPRYSRLFYWGTYRVIRQKAIVAATNKMTG